ncbi:MAG TPA: RidA family protein [Nitrososphaerales archaeon]|nr:RidA family protein [Nitrososphaerales archaeon]
MESIKSQDAPDAIGPYSQAISYKDLVFLSGQIPINPKTGNIEATTIEGQTEQVMKNLQAVLSAAGSGLSRALKCTVFLSDLKDFPAFNKAYEAFFNETPPARSTVQVSGLPRNAKVEIDMIASRQL